MGVEDTLTQAVDAIDKGGRIVVLGVFGDKPKIDMSVVGEHELSLIGTLMYRHEDYVQAIEWIAEGKIQTEPLDSKHVPFERYAEAYTFIDAQGDKSMKVFIDM